MDPRRESGQGADSENSGQKTPNIQPDQLPDLPHWWAQERAWEEGTSFSGGCLHWCAMVNFSWCKRAVGAGPDLAMQGFTQGTVHTQSLFSAAQWVCGSLQTKQ